MSSAASWGLVVAGLACGSCAGPAVWAGQRGPGTTMTSTPSVTSHYEPIAFSDLAGWERDDHLAAFRAFEKSCARLRKAAAARSSPGAPPLAGADLVAACAAAAARSSGKVDRASARAFFEATFVPHRVVHDGPAGLLTGYYEPMLTGSREPTEKYIVPVYRRPPELENVVAESERGAKGGAPTHVRRTAHGTEPFATRAEIEQGALAGRGLELMWLADPVDAFFMQVQGSGRIELADGSRVRITYDGKNGHAYVSVGRALIESGEMTAEEMNLQNLGRWLRADRERGRKAMWRNPSFVFFRELAGVEAGSAMGALEIPLTAGRSLAVDTAFHALGTPVWVAAESLAHAGAATRGQGGFNRLMIAQDVGSAIRGPERGDIYFGAGARAGRLAGVTKHPGVFVVLLAKATTARMKTARQRQTGP